MVDARSQAARCKEGACRGFVRPVARPQDQPEIQAFEAARAGDVATYICDVCKTVYVEEDYLELSLDQFEGRIKPASE